MLKMNSAGSLQPLSQLQLSSMVTTQDMIAGNSLNEGAKKKAVDTDMKE